MRPASPKGGDGHPIGCRCIEKCLVPCDNDEIGIAHATGGGEVDSVVPPQAMSLGQVSRTVSEFIVDFDEVELLVSRVEFGYRSPKLASCQSSEAIRLREGATTLRVHKADAHDPVCSVPQRRSTSGARLDHEQRHDR